MSKDEQRILFLFGLHIISLSKAVFHLQPFVMAATTAATTAFGRKRFGRKNRPAKTSFVESCCTSRVIKCLSSFRLKRRGLMTDKSIKYFRAERSSTFTVFDSRSNNVRKDGYFVPSEHWPSPCAVAHELLEALSPWKN